MSSAAKRDTASSLPERGAPRYFIHELEPGRSVTVDVRRELELEGVKMGRYVVAAVMELDNSWEEPTQAEIDYEQLRAALTDEEPSEPAVHRAAYQLLWFGTDKVQRYEDGTYRPFAFPGLGFHGPVAIMGEEFLGKDTHGRRVFSGCLSVAERGKWVPFGPAATGNNLDFPEGTDPAPFAVLLDPNDEHVVRIANCGTGLITIACGTPEIDPPQELEAHAY